MGHLLGLITDRKIIENYIRSTRRDNDADVLRDGPLDNLGGG